MEGSLFFSPERPEGVPELVCMECGDSFIPRRITDGVEELCDACYESRLPVDRALLEPIARRRKRALAAD